jgi:hypothetical protein
MHRSVALINADIRTAISAREQLSTLFLAPLINACAAVIQLVICDVMQSIARDHARAWTIRFTSVERVALRQLRAGVFFTNAMVDIAIRAAPQSRKISLSSIT